MANRTILGVLVTNRVESAQNVQSLLTEYGCNIKTRLGLHDAGENKCASSGLLILELCGNESDCAKLEEGLKAISGVQVQKMQFGCSCCCQH